MKIAFAAVMKSASEPWGCITGAFESAKVCDRISGTHGEPQRLESHVSQPIFNVSLSMMPSSDLGHNRFAADWTIH